MTMDESSSAGAGERPYYPVHQRLVLRVDPWKGTALVTAEIGLRRTGEMVQHNGAVVSDHCLSVKLHARVLTLRSVLFDGQPCSRYQYDPMGWERAVLLDSVSAVDAADPFKDTSIPLSVLRYPRRIGRAVEEARAREELIIRLPINDPGQLPEEATLTIVYEITAQEHPLASLHFLAPSSASETAPFAYVQVTGRSIDGMARSWMPCFEMDALSSWELEYHVAMGRGCPPALLNQLQCASSGALCQQFISTEGQQQKHHHPSSPTGTTSLKDGSRKDIGSEADVQYKVFHFKLLDIPTRPAQIGFVIGLFDVVRIPAAPFALAYAPLGMGSRLTLAMEFFSRAFGFINWYLGTAEGAEGGDGMGNGGGNNNGVGATNVAFPYPSYYVTFVRGILGMTGWVEEDESMDALAKNDPSLTAVDEGAPPLANLTLLSATILFDVTIIEQNWVTRRLLAEALASQYFGIRLRAAPWLAIGISGYLAQQLLRLFHGNNEHRYENRRSMQQLASWEQHPHPALADINEIGGLESHRRWLRLKSILTMTILEHRLERGVLQKILSIIWSEYVLQAGIGINGTGSTGGSSSSEAGFLGTGAFLKICKRVSGKDMRSFADQWILTTGCPVFSCSFTFNRRRSTIDVDFKQSTPGRPGKKVIGSLLIRVHEVDGVFDHSVHIDDYAHHFELPVHAKAKKIKKRKRLELTSSINGGGVTSAAGGSTMAKNPSSAVSSAGMGAALSAGRGGGEPPASTTQSQPQATSSLTSGATAVPTSAAEEDEFVSPLSWIRLDPEMEWIATLELHQPEYMLIEQLHHDRDVAAQTEAIHFLRRISPGTASIVEALERTLADTKCFYRVRAEAAQALASCAPTSDTHLGALKLISFYNKGFALQSSETVVVPVPRPNIFDPLSSYLLLTSLPGALGSVRTRNGTLMELIGQILLNQLRFNDNSLNTYGDGWHVARIMSGLVDHLQGRRELGLSTERLSRELLRELDRYAIVERVAPYYRNVVMVAILTAWRDLVVGGIISSPSEAITSAGVLVQEGSCLEVRLAALNYLLATVGEGDTTTEKTKETNNATIGPLDQGLSMLWSQHPAIRRSCATYLAHLPPQRLIRARPTFEGKGEGATRLQTALLRGLRCSLMDPLATPSLLVFIPRLVESASDRGDEVATPIAATIVSGAPRVALRLVLGGGGGGGTRTGDETQLQSHSLAQPLDSTQTFPSGQRSSMAGAGEEPDWFYELAGEQPATTGTGGTTASSAGENAPRLKLSLLSDSISARLQQVHQTIWDNYDSFPFRAPVDTSVVGYHEVIREPMDLETMRTQLREGKLTSVPAYCANFRRMIDNCLFFNQPDSLISEQARRLGTAALKELRQAFPEYDPRDIKAMLTGASTAVNVPKGSAAKRQKKKQPQPASSLPPLRHSGAAKKKKPRIDQMSQKERMEKVLGMTREHPYAFWFLNPIDPVALGIPHYPQVIQEPMDLSTVGERLQEGAFQTDPHEFIRLLELIFANCTAFNPANTVVHQNALEMRKAVLRLCKKYLPELMSGSEDGNKVNGESMGVVDTAVPSSLPSSLPSPSTPVPSTKITLKLPSSAPTSVPSKAREERGGADWLKRAKTVIDQVSSHEHAVPFLEPVDPVALDLPTYPQIIKNPMDLGTVRTKLTKGEYATPAELHRDVTLIFSNCYRFNGKTAPISETARSLQSLYNRLYNEQLRRA